MRVWDPYLSENDKKMLAIRPPRQKTGIGERPALIVIDMQMVVMGEDRPFYEQCEEAPFTCGDTAWAALRHMETLIPRVRATGWPVVYTKSIYHPHYGLPRANPENPFSVLNPLSEIPPEIAMEDGDILVEKIQASVFYQTNLIKLLLSKNVDSLIMVGNSTSGCVRASVVDTFGYNFKVSVVEECTFDRIDASHAVSLFDLDFKYCDVIGVDALYAHLDAVANGAGTGA